MHLRTMLTHEGRDPHAWPWAPSLVAPASLVCGPCIPSRGHSPSCFVGDAWPHAAHAIPLHEDRWSWFGLSEAVAWPTPPSCVADLGPREAERSP
jgi:hypothetical protein